MKQKGFTIVELLIVIVVLGILAALVLNAYSGVQQRARNAQTLSAINAYRKALIQYATEQGDYPQVTGQNTVCLGEFNPDSDGDGTGDCVSSIAREESADLNNELRQYLPSPLPKVNEKEILWGGEWKRGAFLLTNNSEMTVDGVPNPWGFQYYMEGETTCGIPALTGDTALSGYPYMLSDNPGGHTGQRDGNTRCIVALPNL
jgi:prepilin-type N-terminal cleavage/methylation domain-containing protein